MAAYRLVGGRLLQEEDEDQEDNLIQHETKDGSEMEKNYNST